MTPQNITETFSSLNAWKRGGQRAPRKPALSGDYRILISEAAHGTTRFKQLVTAFNGKALKIPQRPEYQPRHSFVRWHVKGVFRGPEKYGGIV